jgi:protein-arginine kinase activator protein McsA
VLAVRLRPDVRRASDPDERLATCRRCGVRLHVLPEDRRFGFCFDCYDPSDVRNALR